MFKYFSFIGMHASTCFSENVCQLRIILRNKCQGPILTTDKYGNSSVNLPEITLLVAELSVRVTLHALQELPL